MLETVCLAFVLVDGRWFLHGSCFNLLLRLVAELAGSPTEPAVYSHGSADSDGDRFSELDRGVTELENEVSTRLRGAGESDRLFLLTLRVKKEEDELLMQRLFAASTNTDLSRTTSRNSRGGEFRRSAPERTPRPLTWSTSRLQCQKDV